MGGNNRNTKSLDSPSTDYRAGKARIAGVAKHASQMSIDS